MDEETRLLEDRPRDKPPGGSAMLEDLCEATERCESPDRGNYERVHIPFDRKIGLPAIPHAFGVGNISASTDDGYFSFPDNLRDGKDGAVDVGLGVPVAGNQKHVFTDVNTRFVDTEGRSGPAELALHINVPNVVGRLVDWDVCVESDYLPARPQWPELITLDKGSSLLLCESRDGKKKKKRL